MRNEAAMKKHALLVGVEEYRDKMISRLNFARADAIALGERLSDRCGFDHVRVLAEEGGDDEPLLVSIVTALRDTAAELERDDLFVFFFAGHGVEKDGHGYLLARDSLQAFPEHGSLSLELLRKTFESLSARMRVLILDACRNSPDAGRSGSGNRMGDVVSRDIVAAAQSNSLDGTITSLLSACRSGQRAYEWPAKGHGVFTYYLLDGLDGGAWAGPSLELRALAAYVADHVRGWSSKTPGLPCLQEPWYEEFGYPATITIAHHGGTPAVHSRRTPPDASESGLGSDGLLRGSVAQDIEEWQVASRKGTKLSEYISATYETRLTDWETGADRGWPEAQLLLGKCYELGMGKMQSNKKACDCYRKAAEQDFPLAQFSYGSCYLNGDGMEQDEEEAIKWYRRAERQGLERAHEVLTLLKKRLNWLRMAIYLLSASLGMFTEAAMV